MCSLSLTHKVSPVSVDSWPVSEDELSPRHLCLGLHVRGTRDPRMTSPVTGPRVSFGKMVRTAVE